MKWVIWIVGGLAILVLIVAIVGALIPKAHTASRTARIAMPPEALYALLSDVDRHPAWRTDVIFRSMARFVFGYHATMDGFLKNLQARQ